MRFFSIMTPLLDAADAGSGGGGSTGAGDSGQTQTQTQQTATQTGTNTGTQQTTQQTSSQPSGQTASTTGFSYKEDRSDWVPRHRLNETSSKARDLETQLADTNRRLTIALGGNPADPNAEKASKIADAFFALPGMSKLRRFVDLEDEQLEQLLQVPAHVSQSRQAEAQRWEQHGNKQLDEVSTRVAEAIGADTLDDDQRGDLRTSMRSWLESKAKAELQQAADRYGEEAVARDQRRFSPTLRRYEDGDAKLLDEFVTRYTKNWVEPARRSATARTSTRTRAVPENSGRQAVTSVTRPASFKNWDERLDYAAKVAKERGVSFDR